jgi:hypothetical protein
VGELLGTDSHDVHRITDDERVKLEKAAFAFGSFAPGGH